MVTQSVCRYLNIENLNRLFYEELSDQWLQFQFLADLHGFILLAFAACVSPYFYQWCQFCKKEILLWLLKSQSRPRVCYGVANPHGPSRSQEVSNKGTANLAFKVSIMCLKITTAAVGRGSGQAVTVLAFEIWRLEFESYRSLQLLCKIFVWKQQREAGVGLFLKKDPNRFFLAIGIKKRRPIFKIQFD